ncbi:MAG: TetR/AcrR family transcriptional regulator [Acidimicrobiales bacterium]
MDNSTVEHQRHSADHEAGGRPRDPTRDEVIREAALELVAEQGYERVTVDAIAARAGAGKATLYRRWRSKADLVMDALADIKPIGTLADTGSLRGDLEKICVQVADPDNKAIAVMQGLASALPHDRELMDAFQERFVAPRRAAMSGVFARAVARGEMAAGRDVDLLTSVIPALMAYQLMTAAEPPEPSFALHIVDELLIPAATAGAPTAPPAITGRKSHGR